MNSIESLSPGLITLVDTFKLLITKLCGDVLDVLKREGYIRDYHKIANDNNKSELKIELKYLDGVAVIREIHKILLKIVILLIDYQFFIYHIL